LIVIESSEMVTWNFSKGRVVLLVALVLIFSLWAGSEILINGMPRPGGVRHHHPGLGFLAGAVAATVVDLWVGRIDRSNWRWGLILLGCLLMGGAVLSVANKKRRLTGAGWILESGFSSVPSGHNRGGD
jgi:hypothetical protein